MHRFKFPLILFTVIASGFLLGPYLSIEVKSAFLALSITLKQILYLILPFLIISFLSHSIMRLEGKVFLFIILMMVSVYVSNFTAAFTSYLTSSILFTKLNIVKNFEPSSVTLPLAWDLKIPQLIPNQIALIIGFIIGIIGSWTHSSAVRKGAKYCNNLSTKILKYGFLPFLPFMVFGFLLKMEYEDMLTKVFSIFGPVFLIITALQICYTMLIYFLVAKGDIRRMFYYMKNVFPAALVGFSTMSSASVLPLSIHAAEKNTENEEIARTIIPATVNIHTLGTALNMVMLIIAIMYSFGQPFPSPSIFLHFLVFYIFAKFAVVAVPLGGLLVVIPLLDKYLGFSDTMTGLLTGIYIFFDPFGTAANIMNNGAFAIFFNRTFTCLRRYQFRSLLPSSWQRK